MNLEELSELGETGREIEFDYRGKRYSITYFLNSDKEWISFCEFYQEPTNVLTVNDLLVLNVEPDNSVQEVWNSLREEDVDIF